MCGNNDWWTAGAAGWQARQAGWSAGWLECRLAGVQAGWKAGWLEGRLAGMQAGWSAGTAVDAWRGIPGLLPRAATGSRTA
eukprot:120591-Chlamydomonas_euryale.AAC.2